MKQFSYLFLFVLTLSFTSCKTKEKPKMKIPDGDFSNILTQKEIEGQRLTPEILWKFGRVADVQLSNDGKVVIYNVTRYDAKTNKRQVWIYSVPSNGGNATNLTSEMPSCENPRWISKDKIAFISPVNDIAQMWTMNADGSDKKQISSTEKDITGFEFSADGKRLFYLQDVKLDSTTQDKYPDLPLAKGLIITDLMYRHWDHWHDYAYSHIFISSLNNDKLTEGEDILKNQPFDSPLPPYFDISEISWSPNGKLLAYSCKKLKGKDFATSTNSDIYVYNAEQKTTENITEGMMGYDRNPKFSPDSKEIAFLSMETPGYESDKSRLFVYDIQTKEKKYLTKNFDQNAGNCVWTPDGKKIYFISGHQATEQVYSIEITTNNVKSITTGVHDYTALLLNNNIMIGGRMSMSMANEIFRIDPLTGKETQITYTNKNIYDAVKLGKVEERWVKTTDGKQMQVWVIFPPDFNPSKKYPTLLYCEGGPQSTVSQFFSYRWNFQIMAANNYIIVAPNRRGLPSFGDKWNKQISGDYGGQNIKDYLSAIDDVKKEPYVDADHLGAVGASYGAFSVYFLAGCHQKRFKAFIAHCGMFNLESESAGTEEFFFIHHDLKGYAWDKPKPKSYTTFSPHLYVDKWDTPIMMITGANDFRIPYTESLQAFNAAQLRGIPSKLLFYPDESHWIAKPQNSILWQREFFSWLDKWLK